ncbi:hypothetical protein D3C87_1887300 [compost metagenome]
MAIFELTYVSLIDANGILRQPFAASNSLNRNPEGFFEIHLVTRKRHDKALLRNKELYAIAIFAVFSHSNGLVYD